MTREENYVMSLFNTLSFYLNSKRIIFKNFSKFAYKNVLLLQGFKKDCKQPKNEKENLN